MERSKKRNIFISIALFFVVISSLGYSLYKNKEEEPATAEVGNTEVVDESALVIDEPGTVALEDKYEKVIINVPEVEIIDGTTKSILVAKGVEDGDVTLRNVTSKELILQGGGPNSITISGSSEIESVFFERSTGGLAVHVQDESTVENAFISQKSKDTLLEGNFTNVVVEASDVKVDIHDGIIDSLSVGGIGSIIYANKNTSINSTIILAQADDTSFTSAGVLKSLVVDAMNSEVNVNGEVETLYVREAAENVVVTVAEGAILESFITSVPVTLDGKGSVNKVVADSKSYVTGDMKEDNARPLADSKKETVNAAVRAPSKPKKITRTKTQQLARVNNKKAEKSKTSKQKKIKTTGKSEKLKTDKEKPKEELKNDHSKGDPKEENTKDDTQDEDLQDEDPEDEGPEDEESQENSQDENEQDEDAQEEVPKYEGNALAKEVLETNLDFIYETIKNPVFGTGGGEWSILSLARGGYDAPEEYYDLYTTNVEKEVTKLMKNGKLHRAKGTEHSRLMLAYGALGKDITDVAGYDIREALADFKYAKRQGINGPIFALIALDTHGYEIPTIEDQANQSTRQKFIDYIIDREITQKSGEVGGWALHGNNPDPDITAMAIQGLSPYYDEQPAVKNAIDAAVNWLSSAQSEDGGYLSWGSENSESVSQVIVALTGLGIDPHTDARFIKNGTSAIDNLLTFAVADGGFMHVKPGGNTGGGAAAGKVDGMATDQGTYALVAYNRFVNKQNSLYDMSDVVLKKKSSKPNKARNYSKIEVSEEAVKIVNDAGIEPVKNLSEIKENAQEELLSSLDKKESTEVYDIAV